MSLASALYEGRVVHRRHVPTQHAFSYRMAQLFLDLDEVDDVFRSRWFWSVNRPNLAEWRRTDFMAPHDRPLADVVRQRVEAQTGKRPAGPVRMLGHLRYGGYVFNPVTFYYCYAADGTSLEAIVAEITNTPWRERHTYVLPVDGAETRGRAMTWAFDKRFHVSPFMGMARRYDWRFTAPADDLRVHMKVHDADTCEFDAALALDRRPLTGPALARLLWRYPLMTLQVIGAIHWQALRLWSKRTPVHDHPPEAASLPEARAPGTAP